MPLADHLLYGVGEVVLHATCTPLFIAGVEKGFAVTSGRAEIDLKHSIPPICEKLR